LIPIHTPQPLAVWLYLCLEFSSKNMEEEPLGTNITI
jgi:hypothetical protein